MKSISSIKRKKNPSTKKSIHKPFPIVAIGASAGGLEAMSMLLKDLPADTGMAYIFVQHLSPSYKSFLTSILARITKMKVQEIDDMELMKPNNVYVIPSNKGIEVTDGHIKLLPRSKRIPPISIDVLFASLAETHKENVIGIILSGNANDGTRGVKAIKDAGGITIAQDDSAQVASMPQSAIASGAVDFVLSPKEMAHELIRMGTQGLTTNAAQKINRNGIRIDDRAELKPIFDHLHEKAGVDFSHYKITTINRRLNHRMLQLGIKTRKEYSKLVMKDKKESDLLYKDLLIHVTGFFRDAETFQYLKTTFLPKLLKSKASGETLRIWVVACSTGEEAFSIAMLISEIQQTKKKKIAVKIFATDLSGDVIHEARIGKYSASDMKDISKQRLNRFFTKMGDEYMVSKELREMCVFAPHNVLSDPPFFRMDFISCRNLLIYFDAAAQKKALGILHFALNEGSYLMLGKAETIGVMPQLFTQLNTKFKIYTSKKNLGVRKAPQLVPRFLKASGTKKISLAVLRKSPTATSSELDKAIDAVLLAQHMPACAIINRDMEILQFRGLTSLYLSHPSGKASLNILKMVRPEFAFELRGAVDKVLKTKKTILKSDIEMKINNSFRMISLEVSPLKIEWDEPLLLIVFTLQDRIGSRDADRKGENNTTRKDLRIKKLTQELSMVRTEMHALIESQENAYAELQAANEEIVSTNEEFQTLNEELETSKEEIEATNEELLATNQELKTHNELLAESYNYSQTIIATIHEPMVILDGNLVVKSANKSFYKKFLVTKEETENVSLFELSEGQWNIPALRKLLSALLSKNTEFENFEVTHSFPGLGEKIMLLNGSRIIQKTHRAKLILLAIEDITERTRYHLKEKELLKEDIIGHEATNVELEKAVKRRTKQLLEKNVELETANKDLTSFTYISSHDLQEPLRKIQNFIGLIQDNKNTNVTGDSAVYLKRIAETATRMRKLIDALLTYSRSKRGEKHFEKKDLNILLNEVKNQLQEEIEKKKAVIISNDLGEANVIPFQICQLLDNLVCNSLKFSKPGVAPRIVIKRKIVPGSSLKNLKLPSKEDFIHIRYADNGIGFESKYNERIFEVFQRLHSYESYKGTGIGLAICKRIVNNHNGMITASGKKNKGATFDIYIPVA